MKVMKNSKPIFIPINDLLNCGKDMESLTGIENDFYIDQKGPRIGRISESIDEDYEREQETELTAKLATLLEKPNDSDVGSDANNDVISSDVQLDVSLNRSGHVRSTARTNEVGLRHNFILLSS